MTMLHGTIILIFCSFLLFLPAAGQRADFLFRHIGQPDGLLDDKVVTITQDRRGFIWIGSYAGLQRYDGIRFVNYQDILGGENGTLSGISRIDTARGNRLFINVGWECRKLDWNTNTIRNYSEAEIRADTIGRQRYKDEKNNIWILGQDGIYYQPADLGAISVWRHTVAEDSQHRQTWVMTGGLLYLFDAKSGKVYSTDSISAHHPLLQKLAGKTLRAILADSRHGLWINTWSPEFYRYDMNTGELKAFVVSSLAWKDAAKPSANPAAVNFIYEDHYGVIWLATAGSGLLRFGQETASFEEIGRQGENNKGIQFNFETSCIFQDREDNIWLGTDRGITIFNPYHPHFKILAHQEGTSNTLPKSEIVGFLQNALGELWVGTWGGGITIYDRNLQFKKQVRFSGDIDQNRIWSFLENEGKVWVGCQHGYLHIYDISRKRWTTMQPAALRHSTVRCLQKDGEGNVFFGLHNGKTAWFEKRTGIFHAYSDSTGPFPNPYTPVRSLFVDNREHCWACTEGGLRLFDPIKGVYTATWYPGKGDSHSCMCLTDQDDSTMLIGILRGGLALFHKNTGRFTFPFFRDRHSIRGSDSPGLNPPTVLAIRKDAGGNTWFTTDYGLHRLDAGKVIPIDYSMDPGAIHSAFEPSGFLPLRDGSWLTATSTEIIAFYPDSLNNQGIETLPVAITGLKWLDHPLSIDSFLLRNDPIKLGYQQNFLTIEFSSLRYSNSRQVTYQYQLSGVDRDWVNADLTGAASYTNLSPGKYTFQVRAEDGSQQGSITSFPFDIAPPFWQTWWFRALCLVSVVCFIYWLVRRRIGIIRREAGLHQQVAETEMMALRAQMNPHFIFNCINSIDALIQSNDKYMATIYLNKFAKLIRNILDCSRQNSVTLAKDLETLQLYIELEQFRNDNRFSCEVSADAGLLQDDFRVPPLIIQPYVENAILHGLRSLPEGRGRMFISVSREDGYLTYVVEDNGVGRSARAPAPKQEKQSYGMQMTSDRVRLFNKENKASVEITDLVSNGQPVGTRVKVLLKIQ
jgi:ligand-binding sensor domain-containing protein